MSKIKRITCFCLLCWFTLLTTNAQRRPDADALFLKARDAAISDRYAEARKICRELLSYYPEYFDATILMGRTYAWELKTDSARRIIQPLLEIEPDNYDILTLLADNEIWGGQYGKSMEFIDLALGFYPQDEDFLYKKASSYYNQKDNTNTIRVLYELLTVNPEHIKGNELLNIILPPKKFLDELYARADEEANAGNYKLARTFCRRLLSEDPDHFGAAILMAQTYAFENKFDSARIISSRLYNIDPTNYDLMDLMVNIEIWNRKYKTALTQVEQALTTWPNDENFLFKKARIQYLAKDYQDATKTLDALLEINPEHEEGNTLKKDILENHRYKDYVFVEDYYEFYKYPSLSHKLITSTGISKWTKYGTYIAKINAGEKLPYESLAFQYELEAYQQLFPTNYLYLDYAWSKNDFFPKRRGAVEFFQRLPKGFEASLGIRYIYWSNPRWIYSGSISWLHNKNYLAFRPFFYLDNSRWISSYNLTYRRYFSDRDDYLYAVAGYGNYSDEFMQLNPEPSNSYLMQIGVLKFITVRWHFLASLGYARDDGFRNRFQALAGVRYYFNMFK